jgi:UDP-GlcNAc3NAcA epimerase
MRVVSIVGARPQFIKAAPFSRALRQKHQEYLIHTGQHYDPEMSDVFFEELAIPQPDVNLGIGALPNLDQVGHMLLALRPVIEAQHPDWLIVYGDTNSTLAGALAGQFLHVPVAHIEAGLRSFNRAMPEEINRILTDHVSSALFCPSGVAVKNLAAEGITQNVFAIGDVMIDALLGNRKRVRADVLADYGLREKGYDLATVHRPANTDDPAALAGIMAAFGRNDVPVVLPVHPRLRKALDSYPLALGENIHLVEPVGYLDMLALTASARLVLTDSGGLQKEAYALCVPCVTLREDSEWVETMETGWNRLAGANEARIVAQIEQALHSTPGQHPDVYGDGHASERIVEILETLTVTPALAQTGEKV